MSLRDALVRNTFWYGVVTVVGLASGIVMSVILARGLGPEVMGQFSYLTWAARLLETVATLGFATAVTRYTAECFGRGDPGTARSFLDRFLRLEAAATAVVVALALPLVFSVAGEPLRWPLVLIALTLFPATIESIYMHATYGAQRYDVTSRISTFKMTLQVPVVAATVAAGAGLGAIFAARAVVWTLSCLLQRRAARRLYTAPPTPLDPEARRELRAYVGSLSAVVLLGALVWDRSEVFFLGLWAPAQDIAFYSLAFGLSARTMILPGIVAGALLPALSALHGRGARGEFVRLYRTAVRYVALTGAPIAAVTAALAPELVVWLYGEPYRPVAGLYQALIGVAVLGAMRAVAWAALRAAGDRRATLQAMAVSAAVNVALAALLVAPYRTAGAVVANSVAQVIAVVWAFVAVHRTAGAPFPGLDTLKIGVAAVAAFATAAAANAEPAGLTGLLASAVLGTAAFAAVCLLARVVTPHDWTGLVASTRRLVARAGSR
ncbi:MAG TPA: oligosaccharide flippase family protein [Calidithermus sp.]|nr:oligosaccharide flippase family protein [Calidithermus sp.]